jgi:MFS family permease
MNLSVFSAAFGTAFAAATGGPIFAGLLLALAMSPVQIGVINSLAVLFIPLQIAGVFLERLRFPRKRIWVASVLLQRLAWMALILITAFHASFERDQFAYLFTLLFALTCLFAQIPGSLWFSWMGDLVPGSKQAAFWSRRNAVAQAITVASALAIGYSVQKLNNNLEAYLIVLAAGVLLGVVEVLIHSKVEDPRPPAGPIRLRQTLEVVESLFTELRRFWKEKSEEKRNYLLLTGAFAVHSFAGWFFTPFVFIYLQKDMGFSQLHVQGLSALATTVAFFATFFYRSFGTRFGMKPILVFCWILKILEFGLWILVCSRDLSHWYILIFIMAGFLNIGILIAQFTLLNQVTRAENRALLSAVFFSVLGIAGFVSANLSGVVYQGLHRFAFPLWGGEFGPFQFIGIGVLLSLFVSTALTMAFSERGTPDAWTFFRLVVSHNPVRMVLQSQILDQPLTEGRRTETLSQTNGSLFEKEWIAGLDSPSTWVRGETVISLYRSGGRAGFPPSKALREKLLELGFDRSSNLQPQAILALGQIQAREAIPKLREMLRRAMERGEQTLAGAALVSLGRMEDPLLAPIFRGILGTRGRLHYWPAAAEALGKVGQAEDTGLVFHALDRDPSSRKALYRKLYWIALSRLRDKDSPLFTLYEREEKEAGTGMEKLLEELAEDMKTHLGMENRAWEKLAQSADCAIALEGLWKAIPPEGRRRFPDWFEKRLKDSRGDPISALALLWTMKSVLERDFPRAQDA